MAADPSAAAPPPAEGAPAVAGSKAEATPAPSEAPALVVNDAGKETPVVKLADVTFDPATLCAQMVALRKHTHDVPGRLFVDTCAQIAALIGKCGTAFGMASADIAEKVEVLTHRFNELVESAETKGLKIVPAIPDSEPDAAAAAHAPGTTRVTLQRLFDDEIARGVATIDAGDHPKFRAGMRMTQRLMWFLDFVSTLLDKLETAPATSMKECISKAYEAALAPYHGWILRNTIYAALLMSPTREQFEKAVGGPAAMDQLLSIRPALDDLREGIWAKFRKEGLAAKME